MTEMWQENIKPVVPIQILNWVIIALCLFLKIPQIFNLQNRRPSEIKSLSCQAIIMEITGYTIMTLYNYKNGYNVLTYLEFPVILIQVYFMLFYVLKAKGYVRTTITPFMVVVYVLSVICFMLEIIPKEVLNYIMPICTPLGGFAKVTYILGMIKIENSDAISWETWTISVITNGARWFCVYMDTGDMHLLFNYAVSVVLSGSVLMTAIYYQLKQPPRVSISTRRREPSVRRQYHVD